MPRPQPELNHRAFGRATRRPSCRDDPLPQRPMGRRSEHRTPAPPDWSSGGRKRGEEIRHPRLAFFRGAACRATTVPAASLMAELSEMPTDRDVRGAPHRCQQQTQIPCAERDAAFGPSEVLPCDMNEDRAAAAANARAPVMIQNDHDVVETVVAPKPLGAGRIRVANAPVVVAVRRIVAPPVVGPDSADGKRRPGPAGVVRSPEDLGQPPPSRGGAAIALTLRRYDPAPSDGTGEPKRAERQHTSGSAR